MAPAATEEPSPASAETIEEITRIYKSLPPRPSIEEVQAAISVLQTVETEQNLRLEEISKQEPPQDVPQELFSVLQEVKKAMVSFQSHEQRKEAAQLVELDRNFQVFDGLIQKASVLVSGEDPEKVPNLGAADGEVERTLVVSEERSAESADQDVRSIDDSKVSYPSSSSAAIVLCSGLHLILDFLGFLVK